jgi:hypothetical protein
MVNRWLLRFEPFLNLYNANLAQLVRIGEHIIIAYVKYSLSSSAERLYEKKNVTFTEKFTSISKFHNSDDKFLHESTLK